MDEFNQLYQKNDALKSIISKESSESTGMFSSETYYHIETTSRDNPDSPPETFSVKRTQKHFEWLREKILFHHVGLYVPPIFTKSLYKQFYQSFLNHINVRPSYRACQTVQDFLKMEKVEEFDKKWDGCQPFR